MYFHLELENDTVSQILNICNYRQEGLVASQRRHRWFQRLQLRAPVGRVDDV